MSQQHKGGSHKPRHSKIQSSGSADVSTHSTTDVALEHADEEIHMPPPSWVPLTTACSLVILMAGLAIGEGGLWLSAIGLVLTIICLVVWVRAARSEYLRLPD